MKHAHLSDEIDLIAIGPPGVTVIEVKHWDLDYVKRQSIRVESDAERVNDKSKRVAGKLRERFDPGFVRPAIFMTRPGTGMVGKDRYVSRGVPFFGLPEWKDLTLAGGPNRLTPEQILTTARLIEPSTKVAVSGDIRRFAELVNLERVSSEGAPFHRVYRGQHPRSRDRVVLHLFDLSAIDDKQAETLARREFDVVQRWQKSPYVPSLLDSFQEAEHYAGELFYYTLVDSEAPSVQQRAQDPAWNFDERLRFAREALLALHAFHSPDDREFDPLLHRNITPETLRVRHNSRPLFTGFGLARLIGAETISGTTKPQGSTWIAPEVETGGLGFSDSRSDTFSLCKTLSVLFNDNESPASKDVRELLALGTAAIPDKRERLAEIAAALERNTKPAVAPSTLQVPALPAAEYWDEETIVPFNRSRYRIVNRLGKGGIGQTFKVVEVSAAGEEYGTYVAKVVAKGADAQRALLAYRKARQHTTHPGLSALHEIASEWQPDSFSALLKWIDGTPLADLAGVVGLRAEELGEDDAEAMVLRWVQSLCDALWQFHEVGLVHGDVSPRNIIERAGLVVLTDYDTVADSGSSQPSFNPLYCSASVQRGDGALPSDDLFALSASIFQTVFDREPFLHGSERRKDQGLNWLGLEGASWPSIRAFLDRATNPDISQRFSSARDALEFLSKLSSSESDVGLAPPQPAKTLAPQIAPRLRQLLSAYPGSRHGNAETRGLDSTFAVETYVETELDRRLRGEVDRGEVDLVILFGNAGDGKTAFLQNLAESLTQDRPTSKQRLWDRRLSSGRTFSLNLDGSAAYKDRSANALLDDFLSPFQSGATTRNITRALAINSGKMLEWLEERDTETAFTSSLRASLFNDEDDPAPVNPRIRLVDLNRRSLVGGFAADGSVVATDFLDTLLDRFLGGEAGSQQDAWSVCKSCSAQHRCTAFASVRTLRDEDQSKLLRRRLADALQAAHLRGEIHITARELRSALAFILFGLHDCEELHENPGLIPAAYWDRAFAADGPAAEGRQGELLAELARLDPALNADPKLDRWLLQHVPADTNVANKALASARRRAYFEWGDEKLSDLHLPARVLALYGAEHLDRFRSVPSMSPEDKATLCRELCEGIARLEDLPDVAFRLNGLPLRVNPRTPTESCFWVLKPQSRFALSAPLPQAVAGLEVLHTHVMLVYSHPNRRKEKLPIGLELFHLLLALKDGAQLSGAAQDGVFAHLDLFVQRVTQEDVRELYAWHPEREEKAARLVLELRDGVQTLVHESVASAEVAS